ncbi:MAG: 50S ribosomal protein L21 [Planctomycetota bacterium]
MYAIIQDRNRQATVRKGDVLQCDLKKDAKPGDKLVFDEVLLVGNEGTVQIGKPLLKGAQVTAEVIAEIKGPKVIAFRFKRRKNVRRKRGHRERYTQVKITGITA